jgi:tetratricopeptide (TPR) repeat protein
MIMKYLLRQNKRAMRKQGILATFLLLSALCYGQDDPYLEGRACMSMDKYDLAVSHLNEALRQNPGKTDILYQLGLSYFALKNYPAAKEAFYETEKRRKGMGSFYLAKCEVKLNHPQQALNYLKIHLSSRYKLSESEILLDEDLSSLDNLPGWQSLWNEKNWYSSGDQEFQEAMFLKQQGDFLEAINVLNKLEKQGYKRSLVQTEKAALYKELGNPKAAQSALKSAVKSDVRNLDAAQQLALIQLEEGDAEEALNSLNKVIRQDPARFEVYLQRADARSQTGDLTGALEDLDLYLRFFPENDAAIYRKGLIQHEHGKYLDAIQSFNAALELEQGKAAYYFARGLTYASTGTVRYAHKDLSMALDLDPLNGEIWYEQGKLSQELGDQSSACFCYQKAFQYGIFEAGEFLNKNCN